MIEHILRQVLRHQDIVHKGSLYLRRFYLSPEICGWRLMLHKICRPDTDRALHDHPWDFAVLCLANGYIEHVLHAGGVVAEVLNPGSIRFRSFNHTHRIDHVFGRAAWTLVLHRPTKHDWGFWDVSQQPPRFTLAADYFKPGYAAAAAPVRGMQAAR